jgi:cell division protein FtsI (penicillin-binding protein 3)
MAIDEASKNRLSLLMMVCMGLAFVILLRAAYIQILGDSRLETMARRQFQSHSLVRPRRGYILDRNGEPLAVNVEANSLAANPMKIKNKKVMARLLARATDLPMSKLLQRLNEKREFVWIKRHLSDSELSRFKKFRVIDADGDLMDGLWLVKESDRIYPHGHLAAHILGDVNVDSEGLEGTELWLNDRLRGKVGSVSAIKDALGRPTFIDSVAAGSVQDGEAVSLTIDASLQFEVEQELNSAVHRTGSKAGSVIVMDAATGEILAMANEPRFNAREKSPSADRRRNRAVTDGYEPGSTLKAVLATSVLANGGRLGDQVWGERGTFTLQGHKISEAEAHEKFEWVSLKKMIQVSSNIAAAKFALKIGADRYLKTLHAFGFGARTGLGFPGEISGKLPNRKEWSPLTLANVGFGQGILVTPIQMARSYAAILNGGWLVQPTLIKKTKPILPEEAPVRIFSKKVSNEVIEALSAVTVEGGTGVKASLAGYQVAGKTGTAQMVDASTGKYSHDKYIASFIGFPVHVEPKIVIFTALMEPHGVYYAAETAAPLFKEVLNSVANRCSLPTQTTPAMTLANNQIFRDKLKISQSSVSPAFDVKLLRAENENENASSGWVMPSLKGLTPRESMRILQGHDLHLEMSGTGIVSGQIPDVGKTVAEGGTIRLILSEP